MELRDKKGDVRDRIRYNSLSLLNRENINIARFQDMDKVKGKDINYK